MLLLCVEGALLCCLTAGSLPISFLGSLCACMAKEHLSLVICGHVDSGKTSLAFRLLYALGGLTERECRALLEYREHAHPLLIMDHSKEERERGITITCKRREFFTETWRYTLIDTPGHRDFIKNALVGASQADAAILVVPADGSFSATLARASRERFLEGGSRQFGQVLNILGVQQLCVVVNKMDSVAAAWRKERFEEIAAEVRRVLLRVGWRREVIEQSTAIIPLAAVYGDSLVRASGSMPWWTGQDVKRAGGAGEAVNVSTLYDVLDKVFRPPKRRAEAPLCMPVSNTYRILVAQWYPLPIFFGSGFPYKLTNPKKGALIVRRLLGYQGIAGVGDVVLGRLESGMLQPGERVLFLPDREKDQEGDCFYIPLGMF